MGKRWEEAGATAFKGVLARLWSVRQAARLGLSLNMKNSEYD
jgi:hypothetical protein